MSRLRRKSLRIPHVATGGTFAIVMLTIMATGSTAWSQNLTIQQPVIQTFSVNTTVSVPDRGGMSLGGVGRAGASRQSFGFSRPGTSTGKFMEGTSTSVHVWIHDLREMDRMVLESAERQSPYRSERSYPMSPNAAHAANVLRKRHAEKQAETTVLRSRRVSESTAGLHINRRR